MSSLVYSRIVCVMLIGEIILRMSSIYSNTYTCKRFDLGENLPPISIPSHWTDPKDNKSSLFNRNLRHYRLYAYKIFNHSQVNVRI